MKSHKSTRVCANVEVLESRRLLANQGTGNEVELVAILPDDSDPWNLLRLGGVTYFTATDPQHGRELWRTDGTPAGTFLVRDINPGVASSIVNSSARTFRFAVVEGDLFFAANDGVHGVEIWKSDGTVEGTTLVRDVNPGSASSLQAPATLASSNGIAYFTARVGTDGWDVWKTDGTEAGTQLAADLPLPLIVDGPREYFSLGANTYFLTKGSSGAGGGGLWLLDGSAAGATLIRGFANIATPVLSQPTPFVDSMLFVAYGDTEDTLWITDGTAAGTQPVTTIGPRPIGPPKFVDGRGLKVIGDLAYFIGRSNEAGFEPWRSDGTAAGTFMLRDVNPGPTNFTQASSVSFAEIDGKLLFLANDGVTGENFWRSDGSSAGTQLVANDQISNVWQGFASFAGTAFFSSNSGFGRTDGTAAGTSLIALAGEIPPVSAIGIPVVIEDEILAIGYGQSGGVSIIRISPDDVLPPIVTSATDEYGRPSIAIRFSEDAAGSYRPENFTVRNIDTGDVIPPELIEVIAGDVFRRVAYVVFPGLPRGLADGNYRLTIPAGTIRDYYGNANIAPFEYDFFAFNGDANHDRVVNSADFARMASNFNRPGHFGNGDFNASGFVDISDFAILGARFNTSLPLPAQRHNSISSVQRKVPATPIFASSRIDDVFVNDLSDLLG